MGVVIEDRFGFPRADRHLQQRGAHRVAHLEAVYLVVAVEVEIDARVCRVIGKADAVRRHEPSGANAEPVVPLIGDPVLVRDERGVRLYATVSHGRIRRFTTNRAVSGPAVLLHGAYEIQVHQQNGWTAYGSVGREPPNSA